MPFKFHLKKSRQYNVLSKNQYMICIELLDSTTIECTLNVNSLGQECLENVTSRVALGQPEYFSLCYVCRHGTPSPRWVDLDKPLKKQLEKDSEGFNLYLRVIFYITDVNYIQDDMTRYHYYLQLKSDILEDKIRCNAQVAVLLAAYSMQAEFGIYDETRHRLEFLQQNTFFPKSISQAEANGQVELLNSSLCQYKMLGGMTQIAAEECYITMVMQLEGYGHETFSAKDESSTEVILGISINGIMVCWPSTQVTQFYRWNDISNVINHKKTFCIECQTEMKYSKEFTFPESRTAKYMWRLCIAQHTFFMKLQQTPVPEHRQEPTNNYMESETNDSSERSQGFPSGVDDYPTQWTSYNDLSTLPGQAVSTVSASTTDISDSLRALLPSYRPAPDYDTAVQMKYNSPPVINNNPPVINSNPSVVNNNSPIINNNSSDSQPFYANASTIMEAEASLMNNPSTSNGYYQNEN
ncbi:hypothetical protein TKK_0008619 [Trichogramma kaykai]|uniref:Moesin/ezrin/radixin homolog 1 n=1 Tax=Trichogramma kaykai TaxID=54128 RepID=A0ABD2X3Y5_9HYME